MRTRNWCKCLALALAVDAITVACGSDETSSGKWRTIGGEGARWTGARDGGRGAVDGTPVEPEEADQRGNDDPDEQQSNRDGASPARDGGRHEDSTQSSCALRTNSAACDSCINLRCPAECSECARETGCSAIWDCILAECSTNGSTPSESCATNCATQHPTGIATFGRFFKGYTDGCAMQRCSTDCT